MIKGLAITPPVIGRISIGRVIEKNGMQLPEKDDQFTLTTQIQNRDGWMLHPLDGELRDQTEAGKIRSIPVTLPFNDPELNFRAEYTLFDRSNGRPVCAGDGAKCRRAHAASFSSALPHALIPFRQVFLGTGCFRHFILRVMFTLEPGRHRRSG